MRNFYEFLREMDNAAARSMGSRFAIPSEEPDKNQLAQKIIAASKKIPNFTGLGHKGTVLISALENLPQNLLSRQEISQAIKMGILRRLSQTSYQFLDPSHQSTFVNPFGDKY